MNAKSFVSRVVIFFGLLFAIFAAIFIHYNSSTVPAQKDVVSKPIVIELEQDLAQSLTCQGCDDTAQNFTAGGPLEYVRFTPLAVDINSADSVTLFIQTDGSVTALDAELFNGESAGVSAMGNDGYQIVFSHAQVTYGYLADHNHNAFGLLHVSQGATLRTWNLVTNVIDENVPPVSVTDIAADAHVSPYLVNLRMPNVTPGDTSDHTAIAKRFYELFPDDFDFLNIIYADETFVNRTHRVVSNDVQGIGLQTFDYSAQYGSTGNLLGITNYPINTYFDLAELAAPHEIGHQWINYALSDASPHWPISSMAQGIMGFNIPGTYVGGLFPWVLTPDGNGNYRVSYNDNLVNERGFTDIDLYLMGLLPAHEVRPEFVFQNQDQADQLHGGGLLMGPVEQVDANTIIALHGPRIPSAGDAPTIFRVASIIVSRDRFLTAEEMAFFDYMAARGETTSPLPYQSGFATGTTIPFYLATHCLATLSSRVTNSAQANITNPVGTNSYAIFLPLLRGSGCSLAR